MRNPSEVRKTAANFGMLAKGSGDLQHPRDARVDGVAPGGLESGGGPLDPLDLGRTAACARRLGLLQRRLSLLVRDLLSFLFPCRPTSIIWKEEKKLRQT